VDRASRSSARASRRRWRRHSERRRRDIETRRRHLRTHGCDIGTHGHDIETHGHDIETRRRDIETRRRDIETHGRDTGTHRRRPELRGRDTKCPRRSREIHGPRVRRDAHQSISGVIARRSDALYRSSRPRVGWFLPENGRQAARESEPLDGDREGAVAREADSLFERDTDVNTSSYETPLLSILQIARLGRPMTICFEEFPASAVRR
jgi:hypothetical protein